MKWSIQNKIILMFAAILGSFGGTSLFAYRNMNGLIENSHWVDHSYQILSAGDRIMSDLTEAESGARGYALTGKDIFLDPYNDAVSSLDKRVGVLKQLVSDNPQQAQRIEVLRNLIAEKLKSLEEIIKMGKESGLAAARGHLAVGKSRVSMDQIKDTFSQISDEENDLLAKRTEKVKEDFGLVKGSLIFSVLFGALAIVIALVYVRRNIAGPLVGIAKMASKIAVGDLPAELPNNERQDEVGDLMRSFALMIRYIREVAQTLEQISNGNLIVEVNPDSDRDVLRVTLAKMIQYLNTMTQALEEVARQNLTVQVQPKSNHDVLGTTIVNMTDKLRSINVRIREGTSVLTVAIAQILSVTSQVAAGATQTSNAVRETSVTVEEVKQTAQLTSQKAKNVSETALRVTDISLLGKKSVEDSIAGMEEVKRQMESVTGSIMKLSEQTQAIGEIIATVNDLAEQSNLLSVNASIEAAKAGEQGRGFAVVAQEVKTLAEQSKAATAQIRSILNEVQRATGKVVMSAEQGVKVVDLGVKQVNQSGTSIQTLAESVMQAAQAASQITASCQQQLVGVDQVAVAMTSINQASGQSVVGIKQVESAAQNLHSLGQTLKQLVDEFRV